MDKPLHISRLIETDWMRVRVTDISPGDRSIVVLRGPNEAGKTSALRGIIAALGGKGFDPDAPIRAGQESAQVQITLADSIANRLRLTATWTPKNRYLTVYQLSDDGEIKLPAPQKLLDQLLGALTFDPLRFQRSKPTEQLAMLMQAIGQAKAYEQLQARRKSFYDERTIANRMLKDAKTRAAATPDPSPDEDLTERPATEVNTFLAQVRVQQQQADEYAAKLRAHEQETARLEQQQQSMGEELARLEARIQELKRAIADGAQVIRDRKQKEAAAHQRYAALVAAIPGTDAASAKLAELQQHNTRVAQQRQARQLREAVQKHERESERLTAAITSIDNEIRDLVARSELGQRVPGLVVDPEGQILHNGVPISQASGMRQLELSCLIGMAMSPQVRVMCIDEGDRLDPESLKRLTEIAKQYNYQFWMTAVYAGDNNGNGNGQHIVPVQDGVALDEHGQKAAATAAAAAVKKRSASKEPIPANADVEAMYQQTVPLDQLEL